MSPQAPHQGTHIHHPFESHAPTPYPVPHLSPYRMRFGDDFLSEACNRMGHESLKGICMGLGCMRFSLKRIFGVDLLKNSRFLVRKDSLKRISAADSLKTSELLLGKISLKDSCTNPVKHFLAFHVATGPYARVRELLQLERSTLLEEKTGLIVLASSTSEDRSYA